MRMILRAGFFLLVAWLAYLAARAIYRGVRRSMGLPVEEPGQEQRLYRQAVLGTLPSALVPFAYLHLEPGQGGVGVTLLMLPAFFGAAVLWISGVKGLVGLYRLEPRLLVHPTVFVCCVAAAFAAAMALMAGVNIVGSLMP